MKHTPYPASRNLACIPLSLCLALTALGAESGDTTAEFPFKIKTEIGASEFASGDGIVITSLRGDRKNLEPGGRYIVEGTYTLSSAETADLAFFLTSRGVAGSTPVSTDEHVLVTRGSGKFSLKKALAGDGWLHVSFYVQERSHGGVYFGEQGKETSVLRKKTWSDFAQSSRAPAWGSTAEGNRAIIAYLGEPVAAPTGLDSRYNTSNVLGAFRKASK